MISLTLWKMLFIYLLMTLPSAVTSLAQLDAMETKAFKIIGISLDEAESMGLSLRHRRQVGGLSISFLILHPLLFLYFVLPLPPRLPQGSHGPLSTPFW